MSTSHWDVERGAALPLVRRKDVEKTSKLAFGVAGTNINNAFLVANLVLEQGNATRRIKFLPRRI